MYKTKIWQKYTIDTLDSNCATLDKVIIVVQWRIISVWIDRYRIFFCKFIIIIVYECYRFYQ